ncbi:hypothetical protein V8J88_15000 [Massilia sp. W12]|uniref:hypothetical protein n=1 Tax=Massilia sp. W12 TaxID=3126507 RepID=UPI0030CA62F3
MPAHHPLQHAVAINEAMQMVSERARDLNLVALNALLVSKRIGRESAGFRVVAEELRSFSVRVQDILLELQSLVFQSVQRQAASLKLKRRINLLSKVEQDEGRDIWLKTVLGQLLEQQGRHGVDEKDYQSSLQYQLARCLALCRSGAMLAHNGKIEANLGAGARSEMHNIAMQIDRAMQGAIDSLDALKRIFQYEKM